MPGYRTVISFIVAALIAAPAHAAASGQHNESPSFKNPDWRIWTPLSQFDQYAGVAQGLDSRIWFADQTNTNLLIVNQKGTFTTLPCPYALVKMTRGTDGSIYATTLYSSTVVRISPKGSLTSLKLGQEANSAISTGTDGSIWVPEQSEVGRILPDGKLREYPLADGDVLGAGTSITQQPVGDVWFDVTAADYSRYLASMEPANGMITKHPEDACAVYILPTIAAPDGLVWAYCDGYMDGFNKSGLIQHVALPADLGFAIVGGYNNAVIGPDNAIWITGQNVVNNIAVSGAFLRFDLITHKFHKFVPPDDSYEWDAGLAFDASGNLWAGTENGEVQEVIFHR